MAEDGWAFAEVADEEAAEKDTHRILHKPWGCTPVAVVVALVVELRCVNPGNHPHLGPLIAYCSQ